MEIPVVRGKEEKKVAYVPCSYCLDAVALEATDTDHVVAAADLIKNLHSIASKLIDDDYRANIERWLQEAGFEFNKWFKFGGDGVTYRPTGEAVRYMYNNVANLLPSCKVCNQTVKKDGNLKGFLENNVFFGQNFLDKHPIMEGDNYIASEEGVPYGDSIYAYIKSAYSETICTLLKIEESRQILANKMKLIASGVEKDEKAILTATHKVEFVEITAKFPINGLSKEKMVKKVAKEGGFDGVRRVKRDELAEGNEKLQIENNRLQTEKEQIQVVLEEQSNENKKLKEQIEECINDMDIMDVNISGYIDMAVEKDAELEATQLERDRANLERDQIEKLLKDREKQLADAQSEIEKLKALLKHQENKQDTIETKSEEVKNTIREVENKLKRGQSNLSDDLGTTQDLKKSRKNEHEVNQ